MLKEFVCKTDKIDSELEQDEQTFDNFQYKRFFELEEQLIEYAKQQNIECQNAIMDVLNNRRDYKSCKEYIIDKTIRKQIKSYGQWKRQLSLEKDRYSKEKYNYLTYKNSCLVYKEKVSNVLISNDNTKEKKNYKGVKRIMSNNVFVFLADDWGFSKGGINVFNKLLCEAMGNLKSVKVVCISTNVAADKKQEAKENGVDLICVVESDFSNAKSIVVELENYLVGNHFFFIGHDVKTGRIALECKKEIPDSKCAIIHHMAYSEYYPIFNGNSEESEEKETLQRNILQEADIIFANGDGLEESAQDIVGDKIPVVKIYPGVSEVEPRKTINNTFRIVTFGRVEQGNGLKKSNSIIKQSYLATAAWADFSKTYCNDDETTMKIYGKNEDDSSVDDEMENLVKEYSSKVYAISSVKYEENREILLKKLSEFSVCLVLSLKEGFGLTALEAISAGVPLIVSKSSGFYKSLRNLKLADYVYGVDIRGNRDFPYYSNEDLNTVSKAIYNVFKNQGDAKDRTIELKECLKNKKFTWKDCAITIINSMTDLHVESSNYVAENQRAIIEELLNSFNRPVFTSDFHIENSMIEVQDALRDTVSIINTGIEKSSGRQIHMYSVQNLNATDKRRFSELVNGINLLRKILDKAEQKRIIQKMGTILLTNDWQFCGLMNDLRIAILYYVRKIAESYNYDFPDFIISYGYDWNRIEHDAKDGLEMTMMERFKRYQHDSDMWSTI